MSVDSKDSIFHIIYPGGDRSKLSVVGFSNMNQHEVVDYDLASRQTFYALEYAETYGKNLAIKHGKTWVSHGPDYLD